MTAILSERDRLERAVAIARELKRRSPWLPQPGPQQSAYDSDADIVGYGGAAGGGKTSLACGKAVTKFKRSLIIRREGTQMTGIVDHIAEILGTRVGYNGQERIWRNAGPNNCQIEFGSCPHPGDEQRYQGRSRDFMVIDEATEVMESQARFLMGWVRTSDPKIKCQTLMTFNPPITAEGRWIIDFFAPWLDDTHPNPATPGELRWFMTVNGKDFECEDGTPRIVDGNRIRPLSRTFFPALVTDNAYLLNTGYMATLNALPEPLRSKMLYGDFKAGMEDDPWQVIPTAWVDSAMARWKRPDVLPEMTSVGVDVARGGKDDTVIVREHDMWFDEPITYPGKETPDGPSVSGQVIAATRDGAPVHIDVIGVGSSPYDFLKNANQYVLGINVSERANATDKSGRLSFFNLRSQLWWQFREALDPTNNTGIALPPDKRLRSELCAPRWEMRGMSIKVEGREEIITRTGRSPDVASAYILANIKTPKMSAISNGSKRNARREYDPVAAVTGWR